MGRRRGPFLSHPRRICAVEEKVVWKNLSPTAEFATEVRLFRAATSSTQPPTDRPKYGLTGARHSPDLIDDERLVLCCLCACGHCVCRSNGSCDRTLRDQFRSPRNPGAQS